MPKYPVNTVANNNNTVANNTVADNNNNEFEEPPLFLMLLLENSVSILLTILVIIVWSRFYKLRQGEDPESLFPFYYFKEFIPKKETEIVKVFSEGTNCILKVYHVIKSLNCLGIDSIKRDIFEIIDSTDLNCSGFKELLIKLEKETTSNKAFSFDYLTSWNISQSESLDYAQILTQAFLKANSILTYACSSKENLKGMIEFVIDSLCETKKSIDIDNMTTDKAIGKLLKMTSSDAGKLIVNSSKAEELLNGIRQASDDTKAYAIQNAIKYSRVSRVPDSLHNMKPFMKCTIDLIKDAESMDCEELNRVRDEIIENIMSENFNKTAENMCSINESFFKAEENQKNSVFVKHLNSLIYLFVSSMCINKYTNKTDIPRTKSEVIKLIQILFTGLCNL